MINRRDRIKINGTIRQSKLLQIICKTVIFLAAARLFFMAGAIAWSDEGKKTTAQYIKEGIAGINQTVVEQMFPVLLAQDGLAESVPVRQWNSIKKMIITEVIPFWEYEQDYQQPADQMLAAVDETPIYFLEDESTKETKEAQSVAVGAVKKKEAPIKEEKKAASTGKTFSKAQLYNHDFILQQFYTIESTAKVLNSELDGKTLLSKNLKIKLDGENPKILIYHTHGSESFKNSRSGKTSDTIIGVGDTLTSLLEDKYGIPVYHDRTVYDIIDGKLDRNKAYSMSLNGMQNILKQNPSIDVVIDLHRDELNGLHLVTDVNGKSTAKIMFFNGVSRTAKNGDIAYLNNPNKIGNLAFSFQMQLYAAEKYPDFTRRIYIKGYRYNLHVKSRATLIEAGGNTNTVQEVKNAMIPLADILNHVLRGS